MVIILGMYRSWHRGCVHHIFLNHVNQVFLQIKGGALEKAGLSDFFLNQTKNNKLN